MAHLLDYALHAVRSPMNTLAFHLRNAVGWRRGLPKLVNEAKAQTFAHLRRPVERAVCEERAAELAEAYDFAPLEHRSSRLTWRESLVALDALARLVRPEWMPTGDVLSAVDVGPAEWHYVFGLQRFLTHHGTTGAPRSVALTGVEIDGHVLCRDFYARCDHARARAGVTGNGQVEYEVGDFVGREDRDLDVVTMFYPFVTPYALLAWGLPPYHYRPQRLVQRAVEALRPGGLLIVCNQTGQERDRVRDLLESLPVRELGAEPLATVMVPYIEDTKERQGVVFQKI